MNSLYAIISATLLALALAAANMFLKASAQTSSQSAFELYTNNIGKITIALILYFGVFLVYPLFLRHFPINIFFPVYTGLTILMVFFAGVLMFNESVDTRQIFGVGFLILGVVLISWVSEKA